MNIQPTNLAVQEEPVAEQPIAPLPLQTVYRGPLSTSYGILKVDVHIGGITAQKSAADQHEGMGQFKVARPVPTVYEGTLPEENYAAWIAAARKLGVGYLMRHHWDARIGSIMTAAGLGGAGYVYKTALPQAYEAATVALPYGLAAVVTVMGATMFGSALRKVKARVYSGRRDGVVHRLAAQALFPDGFAKETPSVFRIRASIKSAGFRNAWRSGFAFPKYPGPNLG